ncbi:MAG: hypothetical protein KC466_08415 [Myxococcales bacterium]|nr:hypothetical protein [Myxococcales bacterium]
MTRPRLLSALVGSLWAAAACGSGSIPAGTDVGVEVLAVAPFIKYDAAPDDANLFGVQAVVHFAPFGESYGDPAIVEVGREFRLYYAVNGARIELATSADGITWTITGGVLEATEAWEGGRVSGPAIIRRGAEFLLYYEGGDGAGIGLATSSDGVNFVKSAANPLLAPAAAWEQGRIGDPSVAFDFDGGLQMVFDGAGGRGLGAARSIDGVAWDRIDALPATPEVDPVIAPGGAESFDRDRVADPSLLIEDAGLGRPVWRVWYTGEAGGNASPGVAASFNGAGYEKYPSNPVLDEVLLGGNGVDESEPSVLRRPGATAASMYYVQTLGFAQGIALALLFPGGP